MADRDFRDGSTPEQRKIRELENQNRALIEENKTLVWQLDEMGVESEVNVKDTDTQTIQPEFGKEEGELVTIDTPHYKGTILSRTIKTDREARQFLKPFECFPDPTHYFGTYHRRFPPPLSFHRQFSLLPPSVPIFCHPRLGMNYELI